MISSLLPSLTRAGHPPFTPEKRFPSLKRAKGLPSSCDRLSLLHLTSQHFHRLSFLFLPFRDESPRNGCFFSSFFCSMVIESPIFSLAGSRFSHFFLPLFNTEFILQSNPVRRCLSFFFRPFCPHVFFLHSIEIPTSPCPCSHFSPRV